MIAPGMFKLDIRPTQTRTTQLPQDIRRTSPHVSISTGVTHTANVSIPHPWSTGMKDKILPHKRELKNKMMEVEEHCRISKFSNNTKSVTACNDSLNASISNVDFSKGFQVYNKRERLIVETIHVDFDELKDMASDHDGFGPALQRQMTSEDNTLGHVKCYMYFVASDKRQQHNTTPSTSTTVVTDAPQMNIQTTPVPTTPTINANGNNTQAVDECFD
ncbi:hypothetical protein Tco_0243112 [Tanacetum coccineum]